MHELCMNELFLWKKDEAQAYTRFFQSSQPYLLISYQKYLNKNKLNWKFKWTISQNKYTLQKCNYAYNRDSFLSCIMSSALQSSLMWAFLKKKGKDLGRQLFWCLPNSSRNSFILKILVEHLAGARHHSIIV